MFLCWRRACEVSANAVGQVGRLVSPSERVLLNITTLTPPRRVLFRLQCDLSTHNWAFVVDTHLEKPPRHPSYLSRAGTGVSGALCCRGAAFVSHFPASRAAGSPFYSSIRILHRRSQPCVHRVALVLRGTWRGALGFTGRMVTSALTTRKRPTSNAPEPPRNDAASPPHLWKRRAGLGGVWAPCFKLNNKTTVTQRDNTVCIPKRFLKHKIRL